MAKTKATVEQHKMESSNFGYDRVFAHYDEKCAGSVKYEDRKVAKNPKLNKGLQREEMCAITTSAQ